MINIVLNFQIIAADLINKRQRLMSGIQIKARHIEVINRFDQQQNTFLRQRGGGKT